MPVPDQITLYRLVHVDTLPTLLTRGAPHAPRILLKQSFHRSHITWRMAWLSQFRPSPSLPGCCQFGKLGLAVSSQRFL